MWTPVKLIALLLEDEGFILQEATPDVFLPETTARPQEWNGVSPTTSGSWAQISPATSDVWTEIDA